MSKTTSSRLPDTAKIRSEKPRVDQTLAVKARLEPRLNKPYFTPTGTSMACIHHHYGVRLDKTAQRAYCIQCGTEIALFDALWDYHQAEQRLVQTLQGLDEHDKREAERKRRDKERRPFMRAVKSTKPVHDMTLKEEPIIAQIYTLECGHTRQMDGDRRFDRVHCHQCQSAAPRTPEQAAKAKK